MRDGDWEELSAAVEYQHVDEVLRLALTQPLEAIDWTEADELAAQPPASIAQAGELPH